MKFLCISKMRDTASALPPSVIRQLLEATEEVMKQEKKAGKVLEYYVIAGWGRVAVISEVKSAEEMVQLISGLPMQPLLEFESYPLADAFESHKTYIENLKKAEKMFPGTPK
jgi:muconolactone delta-isomerase